MKKLIGLTLILSACIILMKCKDEEAGKREWPRISTLPVTNISEQGGQFNAEITFRGDFEILKYGFVWSKDLNPTFENADKIVIQGNPAANTFSAKATTTLGVNVTVHVRSFVQTSDYIVYGKDVEFISLGSKAPKITSFEPLTGSWGDTILIHGTNFSFVKEENIVKLGSIDAKVLTATDTLITTSVPGILNSNSVKVSVSISGNSALSVSEFNYLIPEITGISKLNGTFLDTLLILGSNFGREKVYNSFYFNNASALIISANPSRIQVVVPAELKATESTIKLVSVGHELTYGQSFVLNAPVINSFSPDTASHENETITIYGKNFNPIPQNNIVVIGDGYRADIIESSGNYLKAILPDMSIPVHNVSIFYDTYIWVYVSEQSVKALNNLHISWHSTYTRKNDFPGTRRHKAVAFSINGKGYFGTGVSMNFNNLYNDFWEYDPVIDQWTRINDFPGRPRAAAVSFAIDNKGYVGSGSENYQDVDTDHDINHFRDFYFYDPATHSWTRVADFGGVGRHSAACFVINDEAYVGTGHWGNDFPYGTSFSSDDFWKYNSVLNNWTEIQKFPEATSQGVGFNINDKGYIYDYNKLFEYDGSNWNILNAVELSTWDNSAFSIRNLGYFGLGSGGIHNLVEYDPVNQSSVNGPLDFPFSRSGVSVFVIDNKAYIVGGNANNPNTEITEVWEFDPTKPEL
jgi:N-acetylneuraminic acid mutarotase